MSSRKLVRSVSTCGEDILDDALNELDHQLDHYRYEHFSQRQALRQQWARRNVVTNKLRPSGSLSSTCSSSPSTSSSSSLSFSSSSSATLSSSESWDSLSDTVPELSSSHRSSIDFPRPRRSSKPKLNLYRPYCKPRRFSLQLVSHPESPEVDDLSRSFAINVSVAKMTSGRFSPPKYSRLSEKENVMKVKSNPTSPSKSDLNAVGSLDANFMLCATHDNKMLSSCSSSFVASGVAGVGHVHAPHGSLHVHAPHGTLHVHAPHGTLARSKSLDDLTCIGSSETHSIFFPKQVAGAASTCDIDSIDFVLQRISTLQV